jgi:thiamine biosynthesis lipoprotein
MCVRQIVLFVIALVFTESGFSRAVNEIRGQTMGTSYSVKYTEETPKTSQDALKKEIDRTLELVNDQMSTWRPGSELSRFNKTKAGKWFKVSQETAQVATLSKEIYKESSRAFDATIGRVVNLWGFGPDKVPTRTPNKENLEIALKNNGMDKVEVRVSPPALKKSREHIYLDFSGIAKGYGVDKVAEVLERKNIHNYMVEIGGELRTKGKKNTLDWKIAIEKPTAGTRAIQRVITPQNMGMATSGDYRNFFIDKDGIRRSHIIDPRNGRPISHNLVSVTVLDKTCARADAMATALMVLGDTEGLLRAKKLGLKALFIVKTDKGFKELYSGGIESHLLK